MPPHIMMHGIPLAIIDVIIAIRSFIMSIIEGSIGISLQIMPSLPISQVILHMIGIMPLAMLGIDIIGIGIGIIIGMPIIPFIGFIPIVGIIIGIGIEFIIGGFIIGIAFIMVRTSYGPRSNVQALGRHTACFPPPLRRILSAAG
jgi:hypothetical protein